jgi:hypothetical protein
MPASGQSKPPRHSSSATASVRGWAGVLSLWRLCDERACRRARCCNGSDPRACMARCLPLAPEGVTAWFLGLAACQEAGLSFDQALAKLAEETEAFQRWCGAVAQSMRSKSRKNQHSR